jgi:hypothetical protein
MIKQLLKILIVLVCASSTPARGQNATVNGFKGIWFTLGQPSAYGDKYSGGLGTYTAKHNPLAVYSSTANKTFFVYGGTRAENEKHLLIMISYYDHATGKVAKPVVVYDKMGVDDPHDNASLQVDEQGYIWVFVSGRNTRRNGYIFRSTAPYAIDEFQETFNQLMAYPQPWYVSNCGFLYLYTRYNAGKRELYMMTKASDMWSEQKKLVGFGGHYQVSAQRDSTVGFAYNWHPGGVDNRTSLYYMQTNDQGVNWHTIDQNPVATPVKSAANVTLVKDYKALGLNVYLKDVAFDLAGHPVILYITSPTHRPGPTQPSRAWNIARWTGASWEFHKITEASHNYDMGSFYAETDGTYRLIAPTEVGPQPWGAGGEMAMWMSTDHGATWSNTKILTANSERNHSYARKPQHANPAFYAFWADGSTDKFSKSHLYFTTREGQVYQLPYDMSSDFVAPTLLSEQEAPLDSTDSVEPIILDHSDHQVGNPPENLLDGNPNGDSRWSAKGFPQQVVIDYGQQKAITGVRLWTYKNRAYQYKIELSEDSSFSAPFTIDRLSNTSVSQPIANDFLVVTARYAKITIVGAHGYGGDWCSLRELKIRKSAETVNPPPTDTVGIVQPTILEHSGHQSDNPPENLLDGNSNGNSRWSAEGFPQYVVVDYGQERAITGVRLWTYRNRAYQYTVALSKDSFFSNSFTIDRSSNTSASQPNVSDFTEVKARYVKITILGAHQYKGDWCSLTEFKIEESAGASDLPPAFFATARKAISKPKQEGTRLTSEVPMVVYPNPASDVFSVGGGEGPAEVSLYNGLGQWVLRTLTQDRSVNIALLPAGLYWVKVQHSQGIYRTKLIKE